MAGIRAAMIILIEGPDGTGKTTLAKLLCDAYGMEYLHFGIPDRHPMDYWFETLSKIDKPTVIDRLHISEEVYGPIYREGSQLSAHDYWLMEGWLWARDGCLLLCSIPETYMLENQQKSVGEYHDSRQKDVVVGYRDQLERTSLALSIFDYTSGVGYPILNSEIPFPIDWEDSGMGSVSPSLWLVGAKSGPYDSPRPFLSRTCFQDASGEFLREALDLLKWAWAFYHVSNALTPDGDQTDLYAKWRRLGYPRAVAMGGTADRELAGAGVPHRRISHPSHSLNKSDVQGYANAIYAIAA